MSKFISVAIGINLSILLILSLLSVSFGFKIDHTNQKDQHAEKTHIDENSNQRQLNEKQINEINYCIMGCVKCANGDIYFKDESVSDTPITVTCANACLVSTDLRDLIYDLSKRKLTKPYAKCLIDHALSHDYY